ncbi:34731_t:CDS:2 [Gigaspora margarita]|uniref:34731_t:CDS:1 n=1 Tax=Gigaspora margarita TaxID=4874 RepID=A0ABN7VNV0_GIGMA|nr:34731_t:CDS:2 [Gigaspora margarita]
MLDSCGLGVLVEITIGIDFLFEEPSTVPVHNQKKEEDDVQSLILVERTGAVDQLW